MRTGDRVRQRTVIYELLFSTRHVDDKKKTSERKRESGERKREERERSRLEDAESTPGDGTRRHCDVTSCRTSSRKTAADERFVR